MKSLWTAVPLVLASMGLAAGLSGCGGGGGSSGGGDPTAPVAISESNMNAVASTVMMAGNASGTTSSGDSLVTGVTSSQAMLTPTRRLIELAITQAKRLQDLTAAPSTVAGVQASETATCDVSGTVTLSANIQTPGSVSPGDTLSVSFANCQIDPDYEFLIDGGMAITINSFSGNFMPEGMMSITLVLSSLHMGFAGATFDANGDMTIVTEASGSGSHSTTHSDSYSYGVAYDGRGASVALTDYDVDATTNYALGTVTWTESFHFSVDFPSFAGSGDVTTIAQLIEHGSDGILSGKLKVVGDNSTLYITYLPDNIVLLELDGNNDGTIDATRLSSVYALNPISELF
jgi:hypothetical protein